jgi:seryl-tRNA synthetase
MLDVRYVADHLDEVTQALSRRSPSFAEVVAGLAELSDQRRALVQAAEVLQAKRNQANQEMAKLAKGGDKALFSERRTELKQITDELKGEEHKLAKV